MTTKIDGFGISAVAIGGLFIFGGVKGYSPLVALQNAITGKNPNEGQQYTQLTQPNLTNTAVTQAIGTGGSTGNKALAQMLAANYGWSSGNEWDSLDKLWTRESGWSNTADTRVTHAGGDTMASAVFAYGIAQARPYSKMPKAGWPPDKGGKSDAQTQIIWGFNDIQATYGSPSAAWAHETKFGWY